MGRSSARERARAPIGSAWLFLPSFTGGGAERATLHLASALVDLGVDARVIVPTTEGPLLGFAEERLGCNRIVDLGSRRVRYSVPALARHLRREEPDVLIAVPDDTAFFAELARVAAGAGHTRLMSVIQNTLTRQTRELGPKRWLVAPAIRWVLGRTDVVVCVSEGVRDDLVASVHPRVEPVVIPNPVDVERVREASRAPVSHPWLSGRGSTIVAAGRLTAQKGFDLLLQAFRLLADRNKAARLLILGEGELRRDLEALVVELGLRDLVELPGFARNPWAYMARAAAYVMSSRFEGMPLALVEALACGAPVVSTDCPSGPAEILEHGRLGILVPPSDAEALAAGLERTLDDPPPPVDLGYLAARYAPERVARQFLEALGSC